MPKEEWRIIQGIPDYQVSNYGRIKRVTPTKGTRPGQELKPYLARGRPTVRLYPHVPARFLPRATNQGANQIGLARLIAYAFHGEPDNPYAVVGYLDGDPCNVKAENLLWYIPQATNRMARMRARRRAQEEEE